MANFTCITRNKITKFTPATEHIYHKETRIYFQSYDFYKKHEQNKTDTARLKMQLETSNWFIYFELLQ